MKLHPDKSNAPTITSYGPGWLALNGEKLTTSMVVGSHGERWVWDFQSYDDLNADAFSAIESHAPELVIFGSGDTIKFPKPAWLSGLISRRIGVETMDTAAACRTYNILAADGRHVIAALLVQAPR